MNKKNIKKIVLQIILIVEIVIFSFSYLFGKNGIIYLINLKKENQLEQEKINSLKEDIQDLKQKINEWNDDFYKEKIAREKLQLSKNNEQIYYYE